MKLSQHQIQTQKQIMAPIMQQSIHILMLPLLDLQLAIDQEIETNPMLEITETAPNSTAEETSPFQETLSEELQRLMDAPPHPFLSNGPDDDELPDQNQIRGHQESLEEKLLMQLHIDLDDPEKICIGEFIIGQINEDGYLTMDCPEIARHLNLEHSRDVEEILRLIQTYEPCGIASRSLEENLLIQSRHLLNGQRSLAEKIITGHLKNLGRKRYDLIAKELKVPIEHVRQCAQLIAKLDPRPARNDRPICPANYITPDIIVRSDPTDTRALRLDVNDGRLPALRINPLYRKLMRQKNLSPDEKTFLKEKLQNALAFIKSIRLRGSTIREIGEYLLKEQGEFFKHGHMALKPMGLKDIAAALERNESTISRAIHHKYIETPQGILPLKYFFSQSIGNSSAGHNTTASRSVKEIIREFIDEEDRTRPLSDQEIQQRLEQQGITIARRTIGKYRSQLNILPSHLRKV